MIEWRQSADTHELLGADLDDRNAKVVVEVGDYSVCHTAGIHLIAPHHSGGDYGFLANFRPAFVKKPQILASFKRRDC
jgi:hypothetical protein